MDRKIVSKEKKKLESREKKIIYQESTHYIQHLNTHDMIFNNKFLRDPWSFLIGKHP